MSEPKIAAEITYVIYQDLPSYNCARSMSDGKSKMCQGLIYAEMLCICVCFLPNLQSKIWLKPAFQ